MVQESKLYYQSCAEAYETAETTTEELQTPPKKVSFLKRFFIHRDDPLIKMTAALPIDHSFPGNHFNLR